MHHRTLFAIVPLIAAACSSSEPGHLLAGGIISGKTQVATAGAAELPQPVTMVMVRNSTGRIALRRLEDDWRDRALDLLAPRAFAQGSAVTGAPVVGAVVCTQGTGYQSRLAAFVPCINTDVDGKAVFRFVPPLVAGESMAEIRGTVGTEPTVYDTLRATILAGPASPFFNNIWTWDLQRQPITQWPVVVSELSVTDSWGNAVPFRIVPNAFVSVADTTVGSVGARTIVSIVPNAPLRLVNLRGKGDVLVGQGAYQLSNGSLESWQAFGTSLITINVP